MVGEFVQRLDAGEIAESGGFQGHVGALVVGQRVEGIRGVAHSFVEGHPNFAGGNKCLMGRRVVRCEGLFDDVESKFAERCDVSHVVVAVRAVRVAQQHDVVRNDRAQFTHQLGRAQPRTNFEFQA